MYLTALHKLTYGMYVVGKLDGTRPTGCIINTDIQITSTNPTIAISVNKKNFTFKSIQNCKKFSLSILTQNVDPVVISVLGFSCGEKIDKFNQQDFLHEMKNGLPIIKNNACAYLFCDVIAAYEVETHYIILGKVFDTSFGVDEEPLTYDYYQKVFKGKAPKNAPTYQENNVTNDSGGLRYICDICGYIYEGDITKEPDDYICPVCGQNKSHFKPI